MRSNNYNMGASDTNGFIGGSNYKMYTDDTTLYSDILSFDDHHPQKLEPNNPQLMEHNDPWLMNQASVSAIKFPATDSSASSNDIFGRLSPTMEQVANSLLPSEMTLPLIDDVSFDVDIALNSFTPQVSNISVLLRPCLIVIN